MIINDQYAGFCFPLVWRDWYTTIHKTQLNHWHVKLGLYCFMRLGVVSMEKNTNEPWSILTIWLMVIPSIIRILIMVIINPYEPLDDYWFPLSTTWNLADVTKFFVVESCGPQRWGVHFQMSTVGFNGNKPLVFCWASTWIHPLCWLVVKNPWLLENQGYVEIKDTKSLVLNMLAPTVIQHGNWQWKKSGVKQHPSCWNFDWLIDCSYNVCLPPANPAFPYEKEWFLVVSHTNT
jgi:hypothetical protein